MTRDAFSVNEPLCLPRMCRNLVLYYNLFWIDLVMILQTFDGLLEGLNLSCRIDPPENSLTFCFRFLFNSSLLINSEQIFWQMFKLPNLINKKKIIVIFNFFQQELFKNNTLYSLLTHYIYCIYSSISLG
jgi:hypothetical protein